MWGRLAKPAADCHLASCEVPHLFGLRICRNVGQVGKTCGRLSLGLLRGATPVWFADMPQCGAGWQNLRPIVTWPPARCHTCLVCGYAAMWGRLAKPAADCHLASCEVPHLFGLRICRNVGQVGKTCGRLSLGLLRGATPVWFADMPQCGAGWQNL